MYKQIHRQTYTQTDKHEDSQKDREPMDRQTLKAKQTGDIQTIQWTDRQDKQAGDTQIDRQMNNRLINIQTDRQWTDK